MDSLRSFRALYNASLQQSKLNVKSRLIKPGCCIKTPNNPSVRKYSEDMMSLSIVGKIIMSVFIDYN